MSNNRPLYFTIEKIKVFYIKGLYFAKEELEEMIKGLLYSAKNHNPEFVILIGEYLDMQLYFDTTEEAGKV